MHLFSSIYVKELPFRYSLLYSVIFILIDAFQGYITYKETKHLVFYYYRRNFGNVVHVKMTTPGCGNEIIIK